MTPLPVLLPCLPPLRPSCPLRVALHCVVAVIAASAACLVHTGSALANMCAGSAVAPTVASPAPRAYSAAHLPLPPSPPLSSCPHCRPRRARAPPPPLRICRPRFAVPCPPCAAPSVPFPQSVTWLHSSPRAPYGAPHSCRSRRGLRIWCAQLPPLHCNPRLANPNHPTLICRSKNPKKSQGLPRRSPRKHRQSRARAANARATDSSLRTTARCGRQPAADDSSRAIHPRHRKPRHKKRKSSLRPECAA